MHSKPSQLPSSRPPAANRPAHRTNSLGNYNRANSMQSYTYTPKPSYVAGPAMAPPSNALRSYSLRSNPRLPSRTNSLSGSIRLAPRKPFPGRLSDFAEDPEDDFDGFDDVHQDDMLVTTKTTKFVDAGGRTRSITTETIRTLPDGSNIIETKTTNLSRSGSRSNSLKNASSSMHPSNPNLRKIEEDLSDFDSTYLDDVKRPDNHPNPRSSRLNSLLNSPIPQLNSSTPQLNVQSTTSEPTSHVNSSLSSPHVNSSLGSPQANPRANPHPLSALESPARIGSASPNGRANSLSSSQSGKRLRSILKNNAATGLKVSEDSSARNDSSAGGDDLSGPRQMPASPPPSKTKRLSSMTSGANSIKFLETVETIPYPVPNAKELQKEQLLKKERMKQENLNLYDQAMQVAMQRVYGLDAQATMPPPAQNSRNSHVIDDFARDKSEKKFKDDVRRLKVDAAGVSPNYIYENHHRDFQMHSMRNGAEASASSRKERLKEEKKRLKEDEKRQLQLLKDAERARKADEKKKKKSPFFIFKKDKRKNSISDSVLSNNSTPSDILRPQNVSAQQASSGLAGENSIVPESAPVQLPPSDIPQTQRINGLNASALHASSGLAGQDSTGPESAPVQLPLDSAQRPSSPKSDSSQPPKPSSIEQTKSPNTSVLGPVSCDGQLGPLISPDSNTPEEIGSEGGSDVFVDVPESLEDNADIGLSPQQENQGSKKLATKTLPEATPHELHLNTADAAHEEPFSILVSDKDGKPRVLSEHTLVVPRMETDDIIEASTSLAKEEKTNSNREFVNDLSGEEGSKANEEIEMPLQNGGLSQQAPIVYGERGGPAEKLQHPEIAEPASRVGQMNSDVPETGNSNGSPLSAHESQSLNSAVVPTAGSSQPQAPLKEALRSHGPMEGFDSNWQTLKVNPSSSFEKAENRSPDQGHLDELSENPPSKNPKSPEEASPPNAKSRTPKISKGGRFKRSIEKYFLTTYK